MRDSEEPFPGHSAIVESLLPSEYYVEAPAELVSGQPHDLVEGIFEERSPRHGELDMRRQGIGLTQVTELRKLPSEGSLILGWHSVSSLGTFLTSPGSRVIKGGGPGVVVHVVLPPVLVTPHLPPRRERLLMLCPGPGRGLTGGHRTSCIVGGGRGGRADAVSQALSGAVRDRGESHFPL